MHRLMRHLAVAMLVLGYRLSSTCAPVDIAGVKVEERSQTQGTNLVLNGAGIRHKAIFKVYVAALYLPQKATTPEEVLAMPGAKRMQITMLREIDSNELGRLFTRGVEDNTPKEQMFKLIPGLFRMGQMFAAHKKLLPGEMFTIDWVPSKGTLITVRGQQQGEPYTEPEFFNALLRI